MANDIEFFRGDAFSFDAALELNNNPVSLNDYNCFFTVKRKDTDPDSKAVVRKSSEGEPGSDSGGITILDAPNGKVRVVLLHDDTKNLLSGTYKYGINVVNKTDIALVYTLLQGNLTINLDIGQRRFSDPT